MNTIKGKVTKLTDVRSGTSASGTAWASQTAVVDYGEMFPILAAFDFDPDKNADFASLQPGDVVEIGYYPQSTEGKNGGYFTNLKPRALTIIEQAPRRQAEPAAPAPAPKAAAPKKAEAAAPAPSMNTDESDDLPF